MKRVRSSRADLSRAGRTKRRWLERRVLLATALLLPALYALSHAALFSGLGASVGTSSHAAPLPPALLARCNAASGAASVQGWALLDELQQLQYTRAVLQGRRDAALQRQPAAAALGSRSNGSASGSRESTQPPAAFLFIGVLSEAHNRGARDAAREAWLRAASRTPGVTAQFLVFGADNDTLAAAAQQEAEQLGDIMLVDVEHASSAMARRTYALLEHALGKHSPQFILKAEDSTFVNVPALAETLRAHCRNLGCRMERMYFGREMNSSRSQQQVDAAYAAHTSLKAYMPYMLGGGYVLSADLAEVILETNQQQGGSFLKFMPSEDISIGVWLMSLDLRRVDHPQVLSLDGCTQEQLAQGAAGCSTDVCSMLAPPLMLQRVPSAAAMLQLGSHLAQCSLQQELQLAARQLSTQQLASAVRQRQPATPADGAVLHLSPADAASQFLLGGYAGRAWSPDGRQLLALRIPEGPAQPASMRLEIGVFERQPGGGWRWEQLNSAAAWNVRRGPMLQWLGPTSRYIVFNDIGCNASGSSSGQLAAWVRPWEQQQGWAGSHGTGGNSSGREQPCAVIYDMQQMSRSRSLPTAIYSVSPDGRLAATLNFGRLDAAAPGSGYPMSMAGPAAAVGRGAGGSAGNASSVPSEAGAAPAVAGLALDDGLWLVDVASGRQQLLVSLQQLFDAVQAAPNSPLPATAAASCSHWVDNPRFSPGSTLVAFTYHVGHCLDKQQPQAHLFVAEAASPPAGSCASGAEPQQQQQQQQRSAARLVQLSEPSLRPASFAFLPSGQLLVCSSAGFYEADPCSMSVRKLSAPTALLGGEPASCMVGGRGGRHVLVSSRIATGRRRRLAVWDRLSGGATVVGEYTASAEGRSGFSHVGLQPALSPDGSAAVFDSSHNGLGWQIYEAALPEPGAADSSSTALASDSAALGSDLGEIRRMAAARQQQGVLRGGAYQPRQLYIDLGSQEGSSVLQFLQRRGWQGQFEVHAWEPDPRHLPQLQQALQRQARQHSISVHDMAAWTAGGTVPFYPFAISGQQSGQGTQLAWWQRLGQLVSGRRHAEPSGSMFPLLTQPQPGASDVDPSSASSSNNTETAVAAADFGAWLLQNARPQDYVCVRMDIAGAEFDVLPALIRDGSIGLIDELCVVWSTALRPEHMSWPEAYGSIFKTLAIKDLTLER